MRESQSPLIWKPYAAGSPLLQERKTEGITAPEDGREPLPGRKIRPQDQTAEEIFVISLIDSYRDKIHTRYQEIYMPL